MTVGEITYLVNPAPAYAFDGADLVAEIRRLADLFPENKAGCRYIGDDDRPLCIAGRALANLGVPLAVLRAYEGNAIDTILCRLEIKDTDSESHWARAAQGYQDSGRDWRQSTTMADRTHPISEVTTK